MSEVKVERHSSRSRCMSCKAVLNARRACDKPGCPMFISAEEQAGRDFRAALAEAEQRGYERCQNDVVAKLRRISASRFGVAALEDLALMIEAAGCIGASDSVPSGLGKVE